MTSFWLQLQYNTPGDITSLHITQYYFQQITQQCDISYIYTHTHSPATLLGTPVQLLVNTNC